MNLQENLAAIPAWARRLAVAAVLVAPIAQSGYAAGPREKTIILQPSRVNERGCEFDLPGEQPGEMEIMRLPRGERMEWISGDGLQKVENYVAACETTGVVPNRRQPVKSRPASLAAIPRDSE